MRTSAASSQINPPRKNYHRYNTSAATLSSTTPTMTTPPDDLLKSSHFFLTNPTTPMPILLHFSWWCCDGNSTFLGLVRCFKATNCLFYQSKLLPLSLCSLLLHQDTPRCPVFQELCEHTLRFLRWASASSNFSLTCYFPYDTQSCFDAVLMKCLPLSHSHSWGYLKEKRILIGKVKLHNTPPWSDDFTIHM